MRTIISALFLIGAFAVPAYAGADCSNVAKDARLQTCNGLPDLGYQAAHKIGEQRDGYAEQAAQKTF